MASLRERLEAFAARPDWQEVCFGMSIEEARRVLALLGAARRFHGNCGYDDGDDDSYLAAKDTLLNALVAFDEEK